MKIVITDKTVRNVLDLSEKEVINLLRYRSLDYNKVPYKIVSPVLLISGDDKFELEIKDVEGKGNYFTPGLKEGSLPSDFVPFVLKLEVVPRLFDSVVKNGEILILVRIRNVPCYIRAQQEIKIIYGGSVGESMTPKAIMEVNVSSEPKAIDDLLRKQISDSTFYEIFIGGESGEFFDSEGGKLDDLVGLVGMKRKAGEGDTELRKRVVDYLKFRVGSITQKIDDSDLEGLLAQADIDKKLDEASKKMRRDGGGIGNADT